MKKIIKIVLFSLILVSCSSSHEVSRIQSTMLSRMAYADTRTELIISALGLGEIDSLRHVARQSDGVQFFIFDHYQLVYWSDHHFAAESLKVTNDSDWCYVAFTNAHTLGKWTRAGSFHILTIIPIKYNYPSVNKHFHNMFIPPFKGEEDWEFSSQPGKYNLFTSQGLFLCSMERVSLKEQDDAALEAFLAEKGIGDDSSHKLSHARTRMYFILTLGLFILLILIGIVGLVRAHGFKNLPLSTKFQYTMVALLFVSFAYIFAMTIIYVQRNSAYRQRMDIENKCRYVQSALQNLYFWDMQLTELNSQGLNIDLRDLSISYETDINVYGMNGMLLGTSTPILFDRGIMSRHVPPEPFFSSEGIVTDQEQVGDLKYLVGYTPFYNGSYMQIGYISVPSFISQNEMVAQIDNYLARILPAYLIVLILALLASLWIARSLTSSFDEIADKMRHYQLGREDNHIQYDKNDEVGELVKRYNELVDELDLSTRRLARSEREGAWRTMARQVAHEINNPLTPMKLTIQQLQRAKGTERFDEYFEKSTSMLIKQIDNLSHIAQSFSTFAKMPEVQTSVVDVASKLASVIEMFANEPIPVRYIGPDEGVNALADNEQISQVFVNIIKNALQALENNENGDIIVRLTENEKNIEISISDNGPGIAEEIQDKIFTPNFTTKSAGSGLGLAISKNIIEGCDGKICFQTSKKGTIFFVYLKKK